MHNLQLFRLTREVARLVAWEVARVVVRVVAVDMAKLMARVEIPRLVARVEITKLMVTRVIISLGSHLCQYWQGLSRHHKVLALL